MNTTLSSIPRKFVWIGIIIILVLWVIAGYNGLVGARQGVDTAWGQVETDYQRRSDLVGQLVSTVKGVANFEKSTLEAVVNARAKATQTVVNADNPESLQAFSQNQAALQSSLSRLLVVSEQYPQLRATESFLDLQSQIEGTENRISVARKDYNTAVGSYNIRIATFPRNILAGIFGFHARTLFAADAGSEKAPTIDFGNFSDQSAPTTPPSAAPVPAAAQ